MSWYHTYASNIPKVPSSLNDNSTLGQSMQREKERAQLMQNAYPDAKFSLHPSHPMGVQEQQKQGIKWAGLPLAKLDLNVQSRPDLIDKVVEAAKLHANNVTGYVSYNAIKFSTGLSFAEVFGAVKAMREQDPQSITFTVNRGGDNVYFKIKS